MEPCIPVNLRRDFKTKDLINYLRILLCKGLRPLNHPCQLTLILKVHELIYGPLSGSLWHQVICPQLKRLGPPAPFCCSGMRLELVYKVFPPRLACQLLSTFGLFLKGQQLKKPYVSKLTINITPNNCRAVQDCSYHSTLLSGQYVQSSGKHLYTSYNTSSYRHILTCNYQHVNLYAGIEFSI